MHPHDTANRVVRIPLYSGKHPGLYAIVDEADAELVSGYRWNPQPGRDTFYAVTTIAGRTVRMHRIIVNARDHEIVDHENGDGLDNRRENLRPCTYQQNSANSTRHRDNLSGFRGVSWAANTQSWKADICVRGERIYLGRFASVDEAARAYDDAAQRHFGDFARLNLPKGGTS